MSKDELAFKDFKNAVSVKEFEAVLSIVEEKYNKLAEAIDVRNKFHLGKDSKVSQMKEMAAENGIDENLSSKILDGLERKSDKLFLDNFKDLIEVNVQVTDFLNRFRESDKQLDYLDLSFLNKLNS